MDMHRIKNVSFIGMAGCGKSTIGKALSKNLEINFSAQKFTTEIALDVKDMTQFKFNRAPRN